MINSFKRSITYLWLTALGITMVYPLIWMFFSSFKTNSEIFGSIKLLPSEYLIDTYVKGWQGSGQFGFGLFFINSFIMVIPTVFLTIASSSLVAYGFTRFQFPLKKLLFSLMLSTLMLPSAVIIIPRYLIFKNLQWLDSYKPFVIPSALAGSAFFVFMMVQFFRSVPKELDESAIIDGCNSFGIFTHIMLPLSKPALFSVGIFQFMWTWNDFFNSIIYINSVKKFTVSLGLRMAIDNSDATNWNQILAMSVLAIIPSILLFFFAQKYFVEGIATTGLKG